MRIHKSGKGIIIHELLEISFVDSLLKSLCIVEECRYGIAVEYSSFESIHSLSYVSFTLQKSVARRTYS